MRDEGCSDLTMVLQGGEPWRVLKGGYSKNLQAGMDALLLRRCCCKGPTGSARRVFVSWKALRIASGDLSAGGNFLYD